MDASARPQRVHRVERPLIVGEVLLVPCIVFTDIDGGDRATPVLWPPHRDEHDGQMERHFHVDTRFDGFYMNGLARPQLFPGTRLEWRPLEVKRTQIEGTTDVAFITGAIKHLACNAIVNGRCPHKGFNMNQVEAVAGVKTCPLHGMRFNAFTGTGLPKGRYREDYTEEELWLRG